MFAKKSYGQHFLANENLAKSIVDSALEYSDTYPILEIGPGKGVLTKYLLESNANFKAVEADYDMIDFLQAAYPDINERLISKDVLKFDFQEAFQGEEFLLFGNYPYNISSQILIKMIENRGKIPVMIGMFQKEVAERIIASPGTKSYGILSVLTGAYYTGEITHRIKPGSFNPPPKVDSAVIKLKRREKFTLDCDEKLFKSIVKITFNQRRKMIRNTLKSLVVDQSILKNDYFNERPERLSVEDFVKLTNELQPQLKDNK